MCGIGGRTVAEARQRISHSEFVDWIRFRRQRGTLHAGMRMDRGFALLASMYANAHSKNGGFAIHDFLPHESAPAPTLEQAMKTWA